MSHSDSSTGAILAQLAAMRATLDTQQAAIEALQADNARLRAALDAEPAALSAISPAESAAASESIETAESAGAHESPPRAGLTSRRGLLRGAAAATAAATVGVAALGAAQPAHAAPLAAGDNFILGQVNDEGSATSTLASSALYGLQVEVSGSGNNAIWASTAGVGNGTAVWGYSPQGNGVYGWSISGTAVKGVSSSGPAVYGSTDSGGGTGVEGYSPSGVGVSGVSNGSIGVRASSNGNVDIHAAGTGRILQTPQTTIGVPSTFSYTAVGESIRDVNGDLWLCVGAGGVGDPGTWVKVLTQTALGTMSGVISYLSKPLRLLDTRVGSPAVNTPGSPYLPVTTHTIQVAGVTYGTVMVPPNCVGAIGNLTVVGGRGTGNYVALTPSGTGFTGTANIAFTAGQTVSNAYNVGLSSGGALDIIMGGGGTSSADVILDLFAVVS